MPSPTNLQTEWARIVVATLADAGCADAIVSPGSRSTPFVLALLREPRIRVTDVIDERVAAFVALGMARVTGVPALLLCTSGTALAHYLPAVIEASESGLPLVVLSADRPPELRDAAANQTIRQAGVYGSFTRWTVDLGVPEAEPSVLRGVRRRVLQAVRASVADKPGPVHVNAPARKPLEPPVALGEAETRLTVTAEKILSGPVAPPAGAARPPSDAALAALATALVAAAGRGLVACGPGAASSPGIREAVFALAAATGFPVLAEAASGLRHCGPIPPGVRRIGAVDALLAAGLGTTVARPDVILQVGRPLIAAGWERVAALPAGRHVVAAWDWPDPDGTAVAVVQADPRVVLDAVRRRLGEHPARDDDFGRTWQDLDAAVWRIVDTLVAARGDALTEPTTVRTLLAGLPDGALLGAGNSLPVRHLDHWAAPADGRLDVLVQRGASGIDGLVAGMIGAHRMARRPSALLLGDVSFAHDLGALGTAPLDGPPLVLVVLDNRGGRLFEQLPVATRVPEAMDHFLTPPRLDVGLAAAAYGLPHVAVDGVAALRAALDAALTRPGTSVIQARVPPSDAAATRTRLAAEVAALVRDRTT